jgi:hypothetical protein
MFGNRGLGSETSYQSHGNDLLQTNQRHHCAFEQGLEANKHFRAAAALRQAESLEVAVLDKILNTLRPKKKPKPTQAAPTNEIPQFLSCTTLLSEILHIIDKTKLVQVIDDNSTQVFADLAELKQTAEFVSKSVKPSNLNLKAIEVIVESLKEIRGILLKLEPNILLDFWLQNKLRLYQLDFLLKIQADQIVAVQEATDILNVLASTDARNFWKNKFTDKVRSEFDVNSSFLAYRAP